MADHSGSFLGDAWGAVISFVIVTIGGGAVWLFRTVFTNQAMLRELQGEIKSRDQRREEDRELWAETRKDVRELRSEVRSLFSRDT